MDNVDVFILKKTQIALKKNIYRTETLENMPEEVAEKIKHKVIESIEEQIKEKLLVERQEKSWK